MPWHPWHPRLLQAWGGRWRERESKGEVTKNIPLTEDLFSTSQPSLYHIVLSPLKTSIKETYKNSLHLLLHARKHNLGSILSTVLNKFMELLAPPTLNPYLIIPLIFVFLSEKKNCFGVFRGLRTMQSNQTDVFILVPFQHLGVRTSFYVNKYF